MFILSFNGAEAARAAAPFAFDPTARVWISGDVRVYDLAMEGTQAADEESEGVPFQAQSAPVPIPLPRRITVLAYRNRFTPAEKVALEIASLDDPSATMAKRMQSAQLRASMKDTDAATFIDLDREDLRTGTLALEGAGILGKGRALEILDAPVLDGELYKGV